MTSQNNSPSSNNISAETSNSHREVNLNLESYQQQSLQIEDGCCHHHKYEKLTTTTTSDEKIHNYYSDNVTASHSKTTTSVINTEASCSSRSSRFLVVSEHLSERFKQRLKKRVNQKRKKRDYETIVDEKLATKAYHLPKSIFRLVCAIFESI